MPKELWSSFIACRPFEMRESARPARGPLRTALSKGVLSRIAAQSDNGVDNFRLFRRKARTLSLKKRHKFYVTGLAELTHPDQPEVLAVTEGRDEAAGRKCSEKLSEGQRRQVWAYRADMGQPFHNAYRGLLPKAQAVVGRFHVAKLLNEAVDRERKEKSLGPIWRRCRRQSGTPPAR
jgi:transposase